MTTDDRRQTTGNEDRLSVRGLSSVVRRPDQAPRPSTQERRPWLSGPQIVIILVLLAGLFLTVDFNRRLALNRRIDADEHTLRQEVAAAEARQVELLTEIDYVQSDAYVERWARYEAKMVKPGEVLVVPLALPPPPDVNSPPPPPPPTPQPWEAWWELFFGTSPGW
jgi:hypothetical protein